MYRAKSREDKLLVALEEAETSAVTWSLRPHNPYMRARSICLCWEPGSRAANTWKHTLNTFDCKKWIFFGITDTNHEITDQKLRWIIHFTNS